MNKLTVAEDALQLAKAIYKSLIPGETWGIVNILKSPKREIFNPPVLETGTIKIPKSFGYSYDQTIFVLEKSGAFLAKTAHKWYIKTAAEKDDDKLIEDNNLSEAVRREKYLLTQQNLFFFPHIYHHLSYQGQHAVLINTVKLHDFIVTQAQVHTKIIQAPIERDYWYEGGQLKFKLADGSIDQLDFSKARVSKKLFEAFWSLWQSDGTGRYSSAIVIQTYMKLHKGEELGAGRIGEIVSNIRPSIINPKITLKNRLEWQFDRKTNEWIFKVF